MMHVHIGHHFFGAGNLGDDLMLAGFLDATRAFPLEIRMTCCTPWDRAAMRLRFPGIEWLPYDETSRYQCIAECDAWLGLGDTPFQTSIGDWMLDHLMQEAQWCASAGKRMFYLCVGVDGLDAARNAKTRMLASRAARIWTRDIMSAGVLREAAPDCALSIGSDLAHIWLAQHRFGKVRAGDIGIVLNFEDSAQYTVPALDRLVVALLAQFNARWLAQEVRSLAGSECTLYPKLAESVRQNLPLFLPDYGHAPSVDDLLERWGVPDVMLTSRYHASLIGAWMGSRVLVFPRSEKVRSIASELGLTMIPDFVDTDGIVASASDATRVPLARLAEHAALAQACCHEALGAMVPAPG